MAALTLAFTFTACDDDDDDKKVDEEVTKTEYHYDLTVTVGKHGGMASQETHLTMSVNSLANPDSVISFKGNGIEITDYTIESIYDAKYMYQVPTSGDRFAKLQIKDNQLVVVRERPFANNTYAARKYTHAWLNSNTLLVMASNGTTDKIIWTKLNTDDMSIISEGELTLAVAEGYNVFTTSGILTYRKSDDKLFYFFYSKQETAGSRKTTSEPFFHIAVIDPQSMTVEQEIVNKEAAQMQGSAYGELMQTTTFFDDDDNLYLSAFSSVNKVNVGQLLRIKKGEFDFEAGYNAFPDALGKIVTAQYIGNGKALAYSGDASLGTGIQDAAYYYSIVDLTAKTATRIQYEDQDLPFSAGSFSQRSVYNPSEKKVYFGVSNADGETIYIYDVATGNVAKGLSIEPGYYFDQIRLVEGDAVVVEKK